MRLLERDDALAVLARATEAARTAGQLVSVSGEAGIGKTAVVRAFAERTAARVVWGHCDALATPRPLGPLLDMAGHLGGTTSRALEAGVPRHLVFAAFLADLVRATDPVVTVFEDVHWADDATLDLLQFVGRRIAEARAVVVISWRDDEVRADHRLHTVLHSWGRGPLHRIRLRPLSVAAVGALAVRGHDAAAVHTLTGGNPFFVSEIVESDTETVPASVRDAVLARRARLDLDARAVLDLVAVVPLRVEIAILGMAPNVLAGLEACLAAGLLRSDHHCVSFRHELARLVVAEAVPPPRAVDLHRRVLDALLSQPDRASVLARIVHHAEASGDRAAVLEHAPAAARKAAVLGAHRAAVDHYRHALQYADGLAVEARARLTEALAYEHYLTSDIHAAQKARHEALALWRQVGDRVAAGRNVRWLSRLAWLGCDRDEASRRADEAIRVLRAFPDSGELAMAYSNRAQLDLLRNHGRQCLRWGTQAVTLARRLGAMDVLSHALNNVGSARLMSGDIRGRLALEQSLELALEHDLHEHAARAYANLGSFAVECRDYDYARPVVDRGIAYCMDRDLNAWIGCMLGWRARLHAESGHWDQACEDAEAALAAAPASSPIRIPALAALGLVRARRGDPGTAAVLDEALTLAWSNGEPQRLGPVLLASVEHAWLAGRRDAGLAAARQGLNALPANAADREALRYWLWKMDATDAQPTRGGGPWARLRRGDWMKVATYWQQVGCPYEWGLALLEGDARAVQQAFEVFHTLGASPAEDWARQRLRQLGCVQMPRGRRASTLGHPAGLTTRESEILGLLGQGLKNPQIARRLFVSPKTVEHHVSSILAKLKRSTRVEAVAYARDQGWLGERRHEGTLPAE